MTIMKKSYLLLYFMGLLTAFGCQQEEIGDGNAPNRVVKEGDRIKMAYSLVTSDFNNVTTRMTTEEENQWTKVWVAQFDANGDLVGAPKAYSNADHEIDISAESGQNTLYFVTNVEDNPFLDASNTPISTLTELQDSKYAISSLDHFDTATELVMVGVWQGALVAPVLKPGDNTKLLLNEIIVYAKRLTAKIDFKIDANLVNSSFQNKSIIIEKIQLCAVPLNTTYIPGHKVSTVADLDNFDEELFTPPAQGVTTYTSKTYYVLENMQGNKNNTGGDSKKGNFAPKDSNGEDLAAYLKIRAKVNDGLNGGHVDYRIYLGKDSDRNFDLERNYHYTITINIHGIGPKDITTDVRVVSRDELYQLQLQRPNGTAATNRGSEIRNIEATDEYWGWVDEPASTNSIDHLRVKSQGADWTLDAFVVTTVPSSSGYTWAGLSLEYFNESTDTWTTVNKEDAIPSDVRIRLKTGINNSAYERTATFSIKLHGVDNSVTREWRVTQPRATSDFNMPLFSFFPAEAGVYAVAIRSKGATVWRYTNSSSQTASFVGTIGSEGFLTDSLSWQTGNGAILFSVGSRGNIPSNIAHRALGTINVIYKSSTEAEEATSSGSTLSQLASASQMLSTLDAPSGYRFAYNYSSDPFFTTVIGFNTAIPYTLNMLDSEAVNYDDDKSRLGTTSPVTGKANTLEQFNKMDRESARGLSDHYNIETTPIFSPAGICMSLNEEYWEIEDVDDPRFEWYLPSRNEALMDAFVAMLGLVNGASGSRATIWTSTVPTSSNSTTSAYFAGMNVDISSTFSVRLPVRCIKRKKEEELSSLTYPYIKNVNNTPVIVVREDGKGFVDRYRTGPTSSTDRYYNISYPYRFTDFGVPASPDGTGPVATRDLSMAPQFQVAKADVGTNGPWYIGAGWKGNLDFSDLANPHTGCQSYTEAGEGGITYDDWRLPTEMELRLIGLLGGGTTPAGEQHILQKGGVRFTDIPGFVTMSGRYWTGTEYVSSSESNLRANYVTVRDLKDILAPIDGTATNRMTVASRARCVRDIKPTD